MKSFERLTAALKRLPGVGRVWAYGLIQGIGQFANDRVQHGQTPFPTRFLMRLVAALCALRRRVYESRCSRILSAVACADASMRSSRALSLSTV